MHILNIMWRIVYMNNQLEELMTKHLESLVILTMIDTKEDLFQWFMLQCFDFFFDKKLEVNKN